jgi:DNA-binding response OmpR family regulator
MRVKARDAGVNEFLVKPISANTLFERIEALIERPRPFVRLKEGFFGPDRRRKSSDSAKDERRREMKKKKEKMTQDEINVLINPPRRGRIDGHRDETRRRRQH